MRKNNQMMGMTIKLDPITIYDLIGAKLQVLDEKISRVFKRE